MQRSLHPVPPGRPCDAETQARILQTALRLLTEQGYSRMSLDAIAAESGTCKPTIYRRWNSKADLATAALNTPHFPEPPLDSGSSVSDLTRALEDFSRSLLRPNAMALIGTVLAEEAQTPDLLALLRARLVSTRQAMLIAILLRAQKRKELRRAVPPDLARDFVAIIWHGIASSSTVPSPRRR